MTPPPQLESQVKDGKSKIDTLMRENEQVKVRCAMFAFPQLTHAGQARRYDKEPVGDDILAAGAGGQVAG